MSDQFIGQIKMFAGNFAPRSWALCDGQLLPIASYDALFALLGTTYGGDGRTTFALPDLRGRVPIHQGSGAGLSARLIGSKGGVEAVTLTTAQMPSHSHPIVASTREARKEDPLDKTVASDGPVALYGPEASMVPMASLSSFGGGGSHNNMQPTRCVNFIIALVGIFPSRA